MCLPAAAQIALTIASGAAQLAAQSQAAKAQAKAQRQASMNEMKRYQHEASSERHAEGQEDTADAMEALKGQRDAEMAIGTILTSAEERGIEGGATGLAVAEFMQANANYQIALEQQGRMRRTGRSLSLTGAGMGYTQNMTNINQPIAAPNFLSTILGTASQAFDVYGTAQTRAAQRSLYGQQGALRASRLGAAQRSATLARSTTGLHAQTAETFSINRGARIVPGLPQR